MDAFCDAPEFAEGLNAFLAAMLVKAVQESPEKVKVVAGCSGLMRGRPSSPGAIGRRVFGSATARRLSSLSA